jgi:hypothetical protein
LKIKVHFFRHYKVEGVFGRHHHFGLGWFFTLNPECLINFNPASPGTGLLPQDKPSAMVNGSGSSARIASTRRLTIRTQVSSLMSHGLFSRSRLTRVLGDAFEALGEMSPVERAGIQRGGGTFQSDRALSHGKRGVLTIPARQSLKHSSIATGILKKIKGKPMAIQDEISLCHCIPAAFAVRWHSLQLLHRARRSPVRGLVIGRVNLIPHQLEIALPAVPWPESYATVHVSGFGFSEHPNRTGGAHRRRSRN